MKTRPFTNVYGVSRTLLALSTLTTLAAHAPLDLFRPFGEELPRRLPIPSIFRLASDPEVGRWAAVFILALVASGWRPRLTGVFHWWVSISLVTTSFVVEGGDSVCATLSLLLIPITLLDDRRWHWDAVLDVPSTLRSKLAGLVSDSSWTVIRLQIAVIYFHASVGKMESREWANGTAIYYWMKHPLFGAPDWLQATVVPLLSNATVVTTLTWGVIVFELLMFCALFISREHWRLLFWLGCLFHFAIFLVHGLATFSLAMIGALVMYLCPADRQLRMPSPCTDVARATDLRLRAALS